MNTALLSSPRAIFLIFHCLKQQMYKQGPARHEKRDLSCSGKGDATGTAGKISPGHLGTGVGFLFPRYWGVLVQFFTHRSLIERVWETNQALADM